MPWMDTEESGGTDSYTVEEFVTQLYQMLELKDAFQSIERMGAEIEVEMDAAWGGLPGTFKITVEKSK